MNEEYFKKNNTLTVEDLQFVHTFGTREDLDKLMQITEEQKIILEQLISMLEILTDVKKAVIMYNYDEPRLRELKENYEAGKRIHDRLVQTHIDLIKSIEKRANRNNEDLR